MTRAIIPFCRDHSTLQLLLYFSIYQFVQSSPLQVPLPSRNKSTPSSPALYRIASLLQLQTAHCTLHIRGPPVNPEDCPRGINWTARPVRKSWRSVLAWLWIDLLVSLERGPVPRSVPQDAPPAKPVPALLHLHFRGSPCMLHSLPSKITRQP